MQHCDDVHEWLQRLNVLANRSKAPRPPRDTDGPTQQQITRFRKTLQQDVTKALDKHLHRSRAAGERAARPTPITLQLAVRMLRLLVFSLCCGDEMPCMRLVSVAMLLAPGESHCTSCGRDRRSCPGNQVVERGTSSGGTPKYRMMLSHYKVRVELPDWGCPVCEGPVIAPRVHRP